MSHCTERVHLRWISLVAFLPFSRNLSITSIIINFLNMIIIIIITFTLITEDLGKQLRTKISDSNECCFDDSMSSFSNSCSS